MATETLTTTTAAVTKAGERVVFPYAGGQPSGTYQSAGAVLSVGGVPLSIVFSISFETDGVYVRPGASAEIPAGALTLAVRYTGSSSIHPSEEVSALLYGASPSNSADENFAAITNACAVVKARGGGYVNIGPGVYLTRGLTLQSGVYLCGAGMNATTLKLADGSNSNVLYASSQQSIGVEALTIDGNYLNQTDKTKSGVLFENCQDVTFIRVRVKDAGGSGYSMQNTADGSKRTRYLFCEAIHNGYGQGASSTGFNGGGEDIVLLGCLSESNWRGGFKQSGQRVTFTGCVARNNLSGGFVNDFSGNDQHDYYHYGSVAEGNAGDGFYFSSKTAYAELHGVAARNNGRAGVYALNDVQGLKVFGGDFRNNGTDTALVPSSTDQKGGIVLLSSFAGEFPRNVYITGATCVDDQSTKTQDYGVYVADNVTNVSIGDGCDFTGNNIQAVRFPAVGEFSIASGVRGYSANYTNHNTVTLTGTTTATDLMTTTIKGNSRHVGSVVRVRAGGSVSGTTGTKIIKILVGSTSIIIANEAAADVQYWGFDATLTWVTTTKILVQVQGFESGGTSAIQQTTLTQAFNADLIVGASATLGSATDSITQEFLHVASVR
jgi:hypothetical protein